MENHCLKHPEAVSFLKLKNKRTNKQKKLNRTRQRALTGGAAHTATCAVLTRVPASGAQAWP